MTEMTITEALAEVKLVTKRIDAEMAANTQYLYRPAGQRDPHNNDGGSAAFIQRNTQSIADLQVRIISIRRAIAGANASNKLTVEGQEMSIADWLVWRREIAPRTVQYMDNLGRQLQRARQEASQRGSSVVQGESPNDKDIVVNINEQVLHDTMIKLTTTIERLDGQLSLYNARILVDID